MKAKTAKTKPRRTRGKRTENKENTRKAILQAALELFAEQGFYRTTTKAISRKAGIAEGTLFNYFETKEDLALYFFEREQAEVIEWFKSDRRMKRADLAGKAFAIIQHFLERLAPYEEFIGAVYLRALAPASKLSPWSLPSQERNLRYLAVHPGNSRGSRSGRRASSDRRFWRLRLRTFSSGDHYLLAAGPLAGQGTNARPARSLPETHHAFCQERRMGLVSKNDNGGAVERGYRLGKLGFSLVGSYLGYQAQNLLLGESGQPAKKGPLPAESFATGAERIGRDEGTGDEAGADPEHADGDIERRRRCRSWPICKCTRRHAPQPGAGAV